MAGAYLTDLLGCRVDIGDADLTLFEGLRLDQVRIYTGPTNQGDSTLFGAKTLLIRYDARELLRGRIRATQIIAVNPVVHITENVDTHLWNYQSLEKQNTGGSTTQSTAASTVMQLPEVILRNGTVVYAEISHGDITPQGSMAVEGQFSPTGEPNVYAYNFQSRGAEELGPEAKGQVDASSGELTATLANFTFGPDIKAMLSSEVRQFCQAHDLQGRVEIPRLSYTPATGASAARFRVEMVMSNVTMSVSPTEWLGPDGKPDPVVPGAFAALADLTPKPELTADGKPAPLRLSQVSGTLLFSDDRGVQIKDLIGRVEGNAIAVDGTIGGYTPAAPIDLVLSNPASENFYVPASPRYIAWMPGPIRNIYNILQPQGTCTARIRVQRTDPTKPLDVTGEVNIVDAQFTYDRFPYPIRNATGKLIFDKDPDTGFDRLTIDHVQGRGPKGGPNADNLLSVSGTISPLDPRAGADIKVWSDSLSDEPALRNAFAPQFRRVLSMFQAQGDGPMFAGGFLCQIGCPIGIATPWTCKTTINLADASATFGPVPYPLQHIKGSATFNGNHVELNGHVKRDNTTLAVTGTVDWDMPPDSIDPTASAEPSNFRPDLHFIGTDVPVDRDLLSTLPHAAMDLAMKAGLVGRVDIDGHVFAKTATTQPAPADSRAATTQPDVDYDVSVTLHDGALRPSGGTPLLDGVTANLHATPQTVTISDFLASRGDSRVTGHGAIGLVGPSPQFDIHASAVDLALDHDLYLRLPAAAQSAWDQVHPTGSVDVELSCTQGPAAPAAAQNASPLDNLRLVIHPRKLSVVPVGITLALDDVQGAVIVAGSQITFDNVTARHGDSHIALSGTGSTLPLGPWDVRLKADDLTIDDALTKALPTDLAALVQSLSLKGKVGVDFSKLSYRPAAPVAGAAVPHDAGSTKPAEPDGPDIDFAVTISTTGLSGDVGVPLTDAKGSFDLTGKVRRGQLGELAGTINADSLTVAGKNATSLKATIAKPSDSSSIQISRIQGTYCSGDLGGDVSVFYPDAGPSRYSMSFVLRNADVAQLAPGNDKSVKGQLTASLTLEGTSDQPTTRRGRGDVSVTGKDMYHIPVLLSLLQITNLSLPINSPFESATASYSVLGQRVAMENITLRGDSMLMQGNGSLDFDTRKVSLTFVTNNPNWPKLPLVGPLIQSAKDEMLQIHVDGTLQDPRVTASSFDSVTTTVDQVFTGGSNR
jgi:hypothetical protein